MEAWDWSYLFYLNYFVFNHNVFVFWTCWSEFFTLDLRILRVKINTQTEEFLSDFISNAAFAEKDRVLNLKVDRHFVSKAFSLYVLSKVEVNQFNQVLAYYWIRRQVLVQVKQVENVQLTVSVDV